MRLRLVGQPLGDRLPRSAAILGDHPRLEGGAPRQLIQTVLLALLARLVPAVEEGQESLADDHHAAGLSLDPLAGGHRAVEHQRGTDVECAQGDDREQEAHPGPVPRPLPGALPEQLRLAVPAVEPALPGDAQEHQHHAPGGRPDCHRPTRLRHCGGRAVSARKTSSKLACPCARRSSSSEPWATTLPSLMITACEHSRVT